MAQSPHAKQNNHSCETSTSLISFLADRNRQSLLGQLLPSCGRLCVCLSGCLSVTVDCGETAERIEMPLGMEVGVGPGTKNKKRFPDPPREGGKSPPKISPVRGGSGWLAGLLSAIRGGTVASGPAATVNTALSVISSFQ